MGVGDVKREVLLQFPANDVQAFSTTLEAPLNIQHHYPADGIRQGNRQARTAVEQQIMRVADRIAEGLRVKDIRFTQGYAQAAWRQWRIGYPLQSRRGSRPAQQGKGNA